MRLTTHIAETSMVIGIVRDALDCGSLSRAGLIPPDVYVPFEPTTIEAVVLARASGEAHPLLRAISDAAPTPAGHLRARAVVLADEPAFGERVESRIVVQVLATFAFAVLLLAATGVFGVIDQSVAQRTREFGIRLALGDTPRGVLGLVLARESKLLLAALGIGGIFTAAVTRIMFEDLAALSVAAPPVWIALVGLCGGTAALSCLLATWRITRLQPASILRRL